LTIDHGPAGHAEQRDTFEVWALLVGRASMTRWFVLEGDELTKPRRAAERAIEIAERIGSMQLLSHGPTAPRHPRVIGGNTLSGSPVG
jgi:hypothetical protein